MLLYYIFNVKSRILGKKSGAKPTLFIAESITSFARMFSEKTLVFFEKYGIIYICR